jgi:glutamine amidotransferase
VTPRDAIGVVDYGMGNLRSVSKALESLGFPTEVSGDARTLASCRGIVFPGVGAFRDCMANVTGQGLLPFLREYLASDRPFLGICVGMQLLFGESEEFGRHEGVGFFSGKVVRFPGDMPAPGGGVLKVPHMGWNAVEVLAEHPVLSGIPSGTFFYFVHSYHAVPAEAGITACRAEYGFPFTAAVGKGNRFAVQFHPEKSQSAGLRLLGNFGRLCAAAA